MTEEINKKSPEVFRQKRSIFYFHLIACVALIGFGSLLYLLRDPNGVAVFHGLSLMIFGGSILLGVNAVLNLGRQLVITGDEVVSRGFFVTKRYRFSEVSALTWGLYTTEIHIRLDRRFKLFSLTFYEQKDFERLAYLFRTGVPEDRQSNWLVFSHLYSKKVKAIFLPELQQLVDEAESYFQETNESALLDCRRSRENSESPVVLRKSPTARYIGAYLCVVGAVFAFCVCFLPDKDGTVIFRDMPGVFAVLIGVSLLLCVTGFLVFKIASKQRITITGDGVVYEGFWRTKRFCFSEVRSLKWGKNDMSLTAYLTKGSFRVDPSDYRPKDFNRIAYFFRAGVPVDRQSNWERMCKRYAGRPVLQTRNVILDPPDPAKGEKLRTRRFVDVSLALTILSFWGVGAFSWFFVGDYMPINPFLADVVVSVLLASFVFPTRFLYPPEGVVVKVPPKHRMWACLWWGAIVFLVVSLMSIVIWPSPGVARFIMLGSWVPLAVVFALYAWKVIPEEGKQRYQQQHERLEKLTVEEFLYPKAVFGHLDAGGENEVELED